jgi:hypothetical protein
LIRPFFFVIFDHHVVYYRHSHYPAVNCCLWAVIQGFYEFFLVLLDLPADSCFGQVRDARFIPQAEDDAPPAAKSVKYAPSFLSASLAASH